jgi:hypothetical protein
VSPGELGAAGSVGGHSPDSVLQVDYSTIISHTEVAFNNLLSLAQELVVRLRSLQFDQREFVCLKFLVLFSSGKRSPFS